MEKLIKKFLPLIKYVCFSGMTAVIESVISLLLINFYGLSEVPANTVGIIIGSIVHYLCVTRGVFHGKVNWKTIAVYASTFLLGMLLQNFVVWGIVKLIGDALNENIRYLAAKACSLVVSFFFMYFIRKLGYRMVSESGNKEA
ncbi:MAG: GtrA family protein [Ruminococcus sp.]|uniref:GtrA family protein n=1 Tax=Ruminococcus sp. TaxID=41978 RepID=UPI0025DC97A9|nr:GtrA family protein [Ruminococcus sp.]MCR5601184.1 GtrA family protein [Ruminococcus sp.]